MWIKAESNKMPSIPERSGISWPKSKQTVLAIGDKYIEAVKNWKTPLTTKEIDKFLGFANYQRLCKDGDIP